MIKNAILLGVLIAALPGTLFAAPVIPGYDFALAPVSLDTPLTLGFRFQTTTAVTVMSLGYFDDEGDGFAVAHRVGIYSDDGNLLASTALNAGTTNSLIGHFRYEAIAPIGLAPNTWYVLAGTTGGDTEAWAYRTPGRGITGYHVAPLITIPRRASLFVYQSDDDDLQFPNEHFRYAIYMGPNMLIQAATDDPVATPEPASCALAAIALMALAGGCTGLKLVFKLQAAWSRCHLSIH